jgi:predicted DNA-binding transcriptional regulator YafY
MANQNKAISSFDIIRKLVRSLYLEGLNNYLDPNSLGKSRSAFINNLNSIQNFLDERFISSKTNTKTGSNPVISFDTRNETENPLYALWKTENSIASNLSFDFAILDILEENPDGISWFSLTSDSDSNKHENLLSNYVQKGIDKKSVKAKLEKLSNAGIIEFFDSGKKIRKTNTKDIKSLLSTNEAKQAIQFASETCPLGVIGSFILDNLKTIDSEPLQTPIHYKHHFIFHTIDYEIMYILLEAINKKKYAEIETEKNELKIIVPLKLFISTQTGRSYIIYLDTKTNQFFSDNLEQVIYAKETDTCTEYDNILNHFSKIEPFMWGVAFKKTQTTEHVRFVIEYNPQEEKYIPERIKRESSVGNIIELDNSHLEFNADLVSSQEIIPWIRSFFGRITDIDFPYSNKIKEDISLLTLKKYRKTETKTKNTLTPLTKNTLENTPLFSPLYSTYYLIAKNVIHTYLKNNKQPLSNETVTNIVNDTAYIYKGQEIYEIINNEKGQKTIFQNLNGNVSTSIKNIPDFPLTTIELRFLASILNDSRIKLFLNNSILEKLKSALKNITPLWKNESIKYFDQFNDSDNFENSEYKMLFQTILHAINNKKNICLTYGSNNKSEICTPIHFDYSQKDDTFRLYVKGKKYPINLQKIKSYSITDEVAPNYNESIKYECLKVEIFDDSKNKYLFNRAIRQFSYFKKTCKKSNKENLYEMTVEYDKNDESEIVIKTLMFGPNIRVIEPSDVIEKISTRISKQDKLFKSL